MSEQEQGSRGVARESWFGVAPVAGYGLGIGTWLASPQFGPLVALLLIAVIAMLTVVATLWDCSWKPGAWCAGGVVLSTLAGAVSLPVAGVLLGAGTAAAAGALSAAPVRGRAWRWTAAASGSLAAAGLWVAYVPLG